MSGDDLEFRKFERDVIEIRDWPAGFRRTKRPCVSDLKTERNAELDTLGIQRVIAAIVGRQAPQPRHDPQRFKSGIANASPKLPHRIHRAEQVNRGYPDEPVWSVSHALRD